MLLTLLLVHFYGICSAGTISFLLINGCADQTIWPAIQGNPPADPVLDPLPAGLSLKPGQWARSKPLPLPWSGRIWARQYCFASGLSCLVGACPAPSCWLHSSGNTTLFELSASDNGVHYDISLGTLGAAPYHRKLFCLTLCSGRLYHGPLRGTRQ